DPDLGDAPAEVLPELPGYVARVVARREDLDRQVRREIAETNRSLSFRQPFETHERQVGRSDVAAREPVACAAAVDLAERMLLQKLAERQDQTDSDSFMPHPRRDHLQLPADQLVLVPVVGKVQQVFGCQASLRGN